MALRINAELCISCAACVAPCPNQAISERGGVYVIDAGRCRECVGDHEAPQCVPECPVDAIVHAVCVETGE